MIEQTLRSNTLPKLKDGISISPFTDGAPGERYLVEVGEVCFVASKDMRDVLAALAEQPETLEELAEVYEKQTGQTISLEVLDQVLQSNIPAALYSHTPLPKNKSPFIFSFRVMPERFVRPISSRLTWLYAKPVVIITLLAFVVSECFVFSGSLQAIHQKFHGWDIPLFYLSLVAITFFHELGHATACRHYECPHGDIGFALYFIYPAFYTDVTKSWRLPPMKRAVVDIGGLYFQCLLIIGLTVYVLLTQSLFASRLVWVMHLTMLYTLSPIFKMDGYWLLTDLSGLSNLHKQVGETLRRVVRKMFRRPGADAAQVGGIRLKVLYLYSGLVVVYVAFLVNFLYRAIGDVIRHYPRDVMPVLGHLRSSYEAGSSENLFWATGALLYMSAWPLCLGVLMLMLIFRLLRFMAAHPLEVTVPPRVGNLILGWRSKWARNV
jgi:putative peptide zinc metalloprotease protein